LRALTDPYLWFAYRIGVGLTLAKTGVTSDVYVGGVRDDTLSGWLFQRLRDADLDGARSA
jgi:hypothetical protein